MRQNKVEFSRSLGIDIYTQLTSGGEGSGWAGANYSIKSINSIGLELSPAINLNRNVLRLSLGYFLKHVEMDWQTVGSPPKVPVHYSVPVYYEVDNYNLWSISPAYGYCFKVLDFLLIEPRVGMTFRFASVLTSVFWSPAVSVYYHNIGFTTLLNCNNPTVVVRREDRVNDSMQFHKLGKKKELKEFVTAIKYCLDNSDKYFSIYMYVPRKIDG